MKACVFIQTNHKQITGAIVAEHALRRYSRNNDKFDVQIMDSRDYPFFAEHEGQEYLRDGVKRVWLNDDLQSFTPTRFMPPKLMGYEGRAVVIDPDIFAAADIWELLSRDMHGKAITLFRQMVGQMNDVLGAQMVDPTTRQKVGASDIPEVNMWWAQTSEPIPAMAMDE